MSSSPTSEPTSSNRDSSTTSSAATTVDVAGSAGSSDSRTLAAVAGIDVPNDIASMLEASGLRASLNSIRQRRHTLAPFEMRQVLDPARAGQAIEEYTTRHLPWIEGIRNTLVVVPVMLTWLAFGLAATAYQQSLSFYKAGSVPPFFQLWQEGFPDLKTLELGPWHLSLLLGQTRILAFAGVAFVDVAILLTIFLLTWRAQALEARGKRKQQRLSNWLELELLSLSEQSFAWTRNPADPNKPAWVNEIEGAVTKLMNTVQSVMAVNDTVAELTSVYQVMKETLKVLDKTMPEMQMQQQDTREMWSALTQQFETTERHLAEVTGTLTGRDHLQEISQLGYRQNAQPLRHRVGRLRAWWRRITSRWH